MDEPTNPPRNADDAPLRAKRDAIIRKVGALVPRCRQEARKWKGIDYGVEVADLLEEAADALEFAMIE